MRRYLLPITLLASAACAPTAVQSVSPARADASPALALPGMDSVAGPLALRVEYPEEGAVVDARDSSFLFGSVGNGRASLTVNGQPVRVWPNGAWLGWVALPQDSVMRFDMVAVNAGDTARVIRTVRRPRRFAVPARGAWVDTTSFSPTGTVRWPRDEFLALGVRAAPRSDVSLWAGDTLLVRFAPDTRLEDVAWGIRAFDRDTGKLRRQPPADRYVGRIRGRALTSGDSTLVLRVINGTDSVRVSWPLDLAIADSAPATVVLDDDPDQRGGTDGITVGRAMRGGTYTWFWPAGTRAVSDAQIGGDLRLDLAPGVHAWIPAAEAVALPGIPRPEAVVGSLTLTSDSDRVVLRIPLSDRVPFQVTESGRRLQLVLYDAVSDANWVRYGSSADPLVSAIAWSQDDPRGVLLTVDLARPVWGYRTRYDHGDLLLEIHRPPVLDQRHPFRNLLIVVDPGHPPVGATGPTGLRERDANLAIALKLRDLLSHAGARIVMTRTTDSAVDLYPRTHLADSLGADLLISIHNNALPDGVNPFTNNGTSVFYNHPQSIPLAHAVDSALVRSLGVRDLGVGRGDLALVRPTWMPSILTEGLFIMLPEQEAALRSDPGQLLYARGVFNGLEQFLQSRAAGLE